MARPNKIGLDYFPLDVDFFEDEKILAISGEFAVKGEIISLRLLCEIYRNGYFVEYSELLKNKLARLGGLTGGLVDEVVSKLVKYGFFDGSLFSEENILTSKGIQSRYINVAKRRENNLCCQYCLINDINVCKNYISNGVNVCKNAQSKLNKIKLKEIKEEKNKIIDFEKKETFFDPTLKNDFLETEEERKEKVPPKRKETLEDKKKNCLEREKKFIEELSPYIGKYEKDMITKFYQYWSEKNKSETKMKFELQNTWELQKRLNTWKSNDTKFNRTSDKGFNYRQNSSKNERIGNREFGKL